MLIFFIQTFVNETIITMNFSIIICTYNRVDILELTLPSYADLNIPKGVDIEVIIVDNNSNDGTAEYVKEFIRKQPNKYYSYIFESTQGLSHARNSGYNASTGDYIAYTDDECILPKSWLETAVKRIYLLQPAFLGGPYFGKFLPNSSSAWYKESFGDSYILQYNLPDGPMHHRYLSGGNIIIRRDVFDKVGLFDTGLGMNGEVINYGEEKDFQIRLQNQFPNEIIYYDSSLFVWHFIRNEKMSITHLFNDAFSRGISAAKMKNSSLLASLIAPILLSIYLVRASFLMVWRLIVSLFSKEHFFTLLHQDYESNTWRSIGGAWYRTKLLFKSTVSNKGRK